MTRSAQPRTKIVTLAIALTVGLFVASCGSDSASEPSTTPAPASTTLVPTTLTPTTTTTPDTTEPATTAPASTAPDTTVPATTPAPTTTSPPIPVDVKVYMLQGERLVIAHRTVDGPAVLRGALTALFAGPTAQEQGAGVGSAIPSGTRLLDVALADGLATIDVSDEFDDGGGSLSMMARLAEVVFTATQFDNVDRVTFRLDGEPLETLGGEGLDISEPQNRSSVGRSFTGGVLIDTPRPGSTVRNPIRVTGEADVFEAQFPIEVWAGDEMIGVVAPVWGGAWGVWGAFDVTIPVNGEPGPIELVAYDEGGCGTDPECPPIVKTVVPLILSG